MWRIKCLWKYLGQRQFLLFALLFYSSIYSTQGAAQQYQDGNVYQNWSMPQTAWNVDTYLWPDRVSDANFFAQTFKFLNNPNGNDGAYVGLMQESGAADRLARFSIWNATASRGQCRNFGGEGVGRTCAVPYNFRTGQWYRLRVWRLESDRNGQWWGAWVMDPAGNETHIGSIRAPAGTGEIAQISSFNEYFGPADVCNSLPVSNAYFHQPSLNAGQNVATLGSTSIARCSVGRVTSHWNGSLSQLHLYAYP